MVCKSLGYLCGCDGTFLFPQAIGHVSQDHEEPIFLESTARVPPEDETQVGPLLALHLTFVLCLVLEVPRSRQGQSVRIVVKSLSPAVLSQINLCCCQSESIVEAGGPPGPSCVPSPLTL